MNSINTCFMITSSFAKIVHFAHRSYEATSSTKNRSLAKELTTGAVASVFLVCQ